MKFKIVTIHKPRTVECNEWDSFTIPGFVILHSAETVPVANLPCAEQEQFGHKMATVCIRIKMKDFRRLFPELLNKGDFVELPYSWMTFQYRWKSNLKQGLCTARLKHDFHNKNTTNQGDRK